MCVCGRLLAECALGFITITANNKHHNKIYLHIESPKGPINGAWYLPSFEKSASPISEGLLPHSSEAPTEKLLVCVSVVLDELLTQSLHSTVFLRPVVLSQVFQPWFLLATHSENPQN